MASVLDKRLIFVTGKGGVGKTTVSAALGLAAARQGKRTIVCEMARQERISRAFQAGAVGEKGVGFTETELAPNLFAISIDPQKSLEEYLRLQVGNRTLFNLLFQNRIFQYFAAAAPGVREIASIAKVWELAQLERRSRKASPYDLVIVDAPATGHGLGMLRAPKTFGDIARVGPIRRQADSIHAMLTDARQTSIVVVALPEEMPINETLDFRRLLAEQMGLGIDAAIVNGVYPERFSAAEIERMRSLDGRPSAAVRAALEAAVAEHQRARTQRTQLRRLRREALDGAVTTLPFLFEPELGREEYERLSRELERKV